MPQIRKLFIFGWNQALCCIFPVVIFSAMAVTKVIDIPFIPRYDLILIICLAMQVAMVRFKLETADELKVITLFHLIGLGLELFKVNMGSWSYPEEAWTKLWGVPLYSGFMYASVASYICQAWRRFDLKVDRWPNGYVTTALAVMIYVNFFTHHYIWDLRWALSLSLLAVFPLTWIRFTVDGKQYRMHVLASFVLIAFFIWLAENISTFLGAWQYPNQTVRWSMVHLGKFSSWFLLIIISIIIVVQLKKLKSSLEPKLATYM
ncbi:hypothetical protein SD71_06945 [Cohnella kolymensis]|uniref:Integral membrane protein n=1 Tax=Cohnella kolymensis TaxID=1590652 RepID=A0ABR5A6S9_9BACL|nr:DUF817 domain-containing protein [Cohnella kolymensis]KIL36724.1 hypothetical protein SD71_06945 [Cohnella kolymensis]